MWLMGMRGWIQCVRGEVGVGQRSIERGDQAEHDATLAYRGHDLRYEGMKVAGHGKRLVDG